MAFIPVPSGIQLCFNFEATGQHWQFCFTLKKSAGSVTTTDLSNVTGIASDWWTSDFKAFMTANNTLSNITATDISSQGGPQDVLTISEVGTATGGSLPLNVAIVASLRTAKRGRSYRGRAYISGLPLTSTNNINQLDATKITTLLGDLATLQNDLDAAGYDIVVASKQHNGVTTNPAETNEVIDIVMDANLDSQRRRLTGRGT